MLISCCHCDAVFSNDSKFTKHLSSVHSHESIFKCKEILCNRSYSSLESFRTHRYKYHCAATVKKIESSRNSILQITDLQNLQYVEDNESNDIFNVSECDKTEERSIFDTTADSDVDILNYDTDESDDSIGESPNIIPMVNENTDSEFTHESVNAEATKNYYVTMFLAKLHNYTDISRLRICDVVSDIDELIESHVDEIISELKGCNELTPNLENILNSKKKPFEKFRSTHLQLKLFSNSGTYIPPEQIKLGEREEFRKKKNEKRRVILEVTAEFIPMRKVLQTFFQLPDVLDKTIM